MLHVNIAWKKFWLQPYWVPIYHLYMIGICVQLGFRATYWFQVQLTPISHQIHEITCNLPAAGSFLRNAMRSSMPAMVHVASPWHTDLTKRSGISRAGRKKRQRFKRNSLKVKFAAAAPSSSSTDTPVSKRRPHVSSEPLPIPRVQFKQQMNLVMM